MIHSQCRAPANNWVQATPGCALCLFLSQRPGLPEKV